MLFTAALAMTFVQAIAGSVGAPTPAPTASPLKEIGHVHSSRLCTTLRQNLFPAVSGLRINDDLMDQGQKLMLAASGDARSNATSASTTGGAGAGLEMDYFHLSSLSAAVAKNLIKVESLLNDPRVFPANPLTEDQKALAQVKGRLEAVVAGQQASLNILSGTAQSDEANDLRSQRDLVPDDASGSQTPVYIPVTAPAALAKAVQATQQTEIGVAPTVLPIVAACR